MVVAGMVPMITTRKGHRKKKIEREALLLLL